MTWNKAPPIVIFDKNLFDLKDLKMTGQRANSKTIANFTQNVTPMIDLFSVLYGIEDLKVGIINKATQMAQDKAKASTIEGALINLENDTGSKDSLFLRKRDLREGKERQSIRKR